MKNYKIESIVEGMELELAVEFCLSHKQQIARIYADRPAMLARTEEQIQDLLSIQTKLLECRKHSGDLPYRKEVGK